MFDIGRDFYERHREDCAEWGLPLLPEWEELTVEQRAGWELQAAEYAMKMNSDREATP